MSKVISEAEFKSLTEGDSSALGCYSGCDGLCATCDHGYNGLPDAQDCETCIHQDAKELKTKLDELRGMIRYALAELKDGRAGNAIKAMEIITEDGK